MSRQPLSIRLVVCKITYCFHQLGQCGGEALQPQKKKWRGLNLQRCWGERVHFHFSSRGKEDVTLFSYRHLLNDLRRRRFTWWVFFFFKQTITLFTPLAKISSKSFHTIPSRWRSALQWWGDKIAPCTVHAASRVMWGWISMYSLCAHSMYEVVWFDICWRSW